MGKTFRRGGSERVTTPLVNLSETSDKKVAQTDQTGQTNQTMTTSPKQTKKKV